MVSEWVSERVSEWVKWWCKPPWYHPPSYEKVSIRVAVSPCQLRWQRFLVEMETAAIRSSPSNDQSPLAHRRDIVALLQLLHARRGRHARVRTRCDRWRVCQFRSWRLVQVPSLHPQCLRWERLRPPRAWGTRAGLLKVVRGWGDRVSLGRWRSRDIACWQWSLIIKVLSEWVNEWMSE